jgi:hypothetical protein
MSAELIPLPPNVTPMPSASEQIPPKPADTISKLLQNPLVIAGGAAVAGIVLTRLFAAAPARRVLQEVVEQALRRRDAGGLTSTKDTLIQKGVDAVKPQLQDIAEKVINSLLSKKS